LYSVPTRRSSDLGSAGDAGGGGFFGKLLFDGLVIAGDAKDHIHPRARILFDRAAIKAAARFDGVIEKFSLGVVALFDGRNSAERFHPFENQADDVNRKSGRRVI